jgi:AAA domain
MTAATTDRRPALHVVGPNDAGTVLSASKGPARLRTAWSAADLMAMDFPPPTWAVPGIIAEGVSLLAGPPKVGKSWLSLGLGLTVAAGGRAFDRIPVDGGPVLYLALEDTPRRLKTRIGKILDGQPAPAALTLATACPPLTQGGDEAIAGWLDRNRDARLVIVDVFAKVRGQAPPGASAYDADYAAVGRIKKVADAYAVAVVLVHHVRKASSEDFLAEVSGTNGLAGAADATLVLKRPRGQADGVLHVTGRDVDEAEYPLGFQPAVGAWTLLDGPADDHTLTDTRATILRWLRANGPAGPKAIAEGTSLSHDNTKKTCQRMLAASQLACDPGGRYAVPGEGAVPPVPVVPGTVEHREGSTVHTGQTRDTDSADASERTVPAATEAQSSLYGDSGGPLSGPLPRRSPPRPSDATHAHAALKKRHESREEPNR